MEQADSICTQLPVALREWSLKRNCALKPSQFFGVYGSFVLISAMLSIFFALRGAWLVPPVCAIYLAGIGVAFLVYARHAADAQLIRLMPGLLVVECWRGTEYERYEFNAAWVSIDLSRAKRPDLLLRCAGKTVSVGTFVPVHRRAALAGEIRRSLRAYR
ncbi:DUF2244 domain-containing protein [Paraburkholderia fungorum]|uniref:DUF2244 domain-containing protein n=1 Tax=Paraburkholderia fungorum TaxID=134537 RepID=UPI002093BAEA|nr:DUF2244 domain-containing protein [Paraburkholderia fungorum]USU18524.1 DUF2244 domain-containing protein [Paraburkholderia fungorum]USU26413.1 DUF2244 domain-containing protein [Paraburkholderia fungorum]